MRFQGYEIHGKALGRFENGAGSVLAKYNMRLDISPLPLQPFRNPQEVLLCLCP